MTSRTIARVFLLAAAIFASVPGETRGQELRTTTVPARRYHGLQGAFALFDLKANTLTEYNRSACRKRLTPASTFKILNSLIALETGVISDEHDVIPWDSVKGDFASWNRDHDLVSAIANSVVWYYQELARRIGPIRMAHYVDSAGYGNRDISGGIDHFWLGSTLTISPEEQVRLLRGLYAGTLPFSARSMDIVKSILILERTNRYVLRGKTGFATDRSAIAVGWFVGYVERADNVYFFACNITSTNPRRDGEKIFAVRKETALAILKDMGVL